jgi:hypothetical protein
VAWPVHEEGSVGRGAEIARSTCAACHVVAGTVCRAEQPSAAVFRDRKHEERRDVIAYILSLK